MGLRRHEPASANAQRRAAHHRIRMARRLVREPAPAPEPSKPVVILERFPIEVQEQRRHDREVAKAARDVSCSSCGRPMAVPSSARVMGGTCVACLGKARSSGGDGLAQVLATKAVRRSQRPSPLAP